MVPTTPGLITGAPTRAGSGSTKPTMSTPSSWRRSNNSRASVTAAGLVPTSSSRSRGARWLVTQANAERHANTSSNASAVNRRNIALLHHQQRKQPIGNAEDQRGRANRAQQPHGQVAGAGDGAQVVEIDVMQRQPGRPARSTARAGSRCCRSAAPRHTVRPTATLLMTTAAIKQCRFAATSTNDRHALLNMGRRPGLLPSHRRQRGCARPTASAAAAS